MLSNSSSTWAKLSQHKKDLRDVTINDLFIKEPNRFKNFSLEFTDILFDYSKQLVTSETIDLLVELAVEAGLPAAIESLFKGDIVNLTEQRPALHTELRNPKTTRVEIAQVLQLCEDFVHMVHNSAYNDIIILGIGGSDLGPRLVCEALKPYKATQQKIHFISNVDSDTVLPLLKNLNPSTTLCLINSKTFTTIETLSNAKIVRNWLGANAKQNCYAVTADVKAANAFGINDDHILKFWDWVGGRYSVWSAVGIAIALDIGMENFKEFLNGANAMDEHFATAQLASNLPVLFALLGIWQINFQNYATLCIQPYADGLELLPQYLQQLEMESNGKRVNNAGEVIDYQTSPVIWGGVGCNGQHAYMQMLHQGTQIVPVDFIVAKRSHQRHDELQQLLVASCLGQSQALMQGREFAQSYKDCPGNRPSNTLMCEQITPTFMGKLIALYEHKVYVQGVIWQIQSFDQWGVQLGKELIKDIQIVMHNKDLKSVDSSTAGLLQYFLATTHN